MVVRKNLCPSKTIMRQFSADRTGAGAWPPGPRLRAVFLTLMTVAVAAGAALAPPVAQDPAYHRFADARTFFGIPNFLNVISSAAMLFAGATGLRRLDSRIPATAFGNRLEPWPYRVFFLGAVLTGIGSAYYHLAPDNARLVWDRLPMTLVFMSLLAGVACERIGPRTGLVALPPLLGLGAGSVIYWYFTEQAGAGDLRPYGFIHFYPALLIPAIMLLYPSRYTRSGYLIGVLGFYGVALACELLDGEIFALGRIVSGHTLKHLFAALAVYWVLRTILRRRPVTPGYK